MVIGYDSLKIEIAENQDPIGTVSPTWTDVTGNMQTMTINRGRDNFWDSYSPGTASFTFNTDFYFSTAITPNIPIRVSVNDSGEIRRYLFAGFLRTQQGFVTDWRTTISSTIVTAVDFLTLLAEASMDLPLSATDPGVNSPHAGDMITFLIETLRPVWATTFNADVGQTLMQDVPAGGTVLDACQNLAFSEGGVFYVDAAGGYQFDDRMAVVATSRIATNQVTFQDTTAGDSTYGPNYQTYMPPVYTQASVTRLGDMSLTLPDGTQGPQTFTYNDPGITNYATSVFPPVTNALMSSNAEAAALVERLVITQNTPENCVKTIRLFPNRSKSAALGIAHLDAAVQRELRDRATFKNVTTAGGSGFDVFVERIQHTIDAGAPEEWTCDLSFTSRSQIFFNEFDPALVFTLDDATKAKLDGSRQLAW